MVPIQGRPLLRTIVDGCALSPLTGWWFGGPLVAGLCLFIAILIFIRHEANIRRLLKGEEPKIGAGKRK